MTRPKSDPMGARTRQGNYTPKGTFGNPPNALPEPTGKYKICGSSNVLHELRFVPVIFEAKRFWIRCPCGDEVKCSRLWKKETGYSFEEATRLAKEQNGIVCGY